MYKNFSPRLSFSRMDDVKATLPKLDLLSGYWVAQLFYPTVQIIPRILSTSWVFTFHTRNCILLERRGWGYVLDVYCTTFKGISGSSRSVINDHSKVKSWYVHNRMVIFHDGQGNPSMHVTLRCRSRCQMPDILQTNSKRYISLIVQMNKIKSILKGNCKGSMWLMIGRQSWWCCWEGTIWSPGSSSRTRCPGRKSG